MGKDRQGKQFPASPPQLRMSNFCAAGSPVHDFPGPLIRGRPAKVSPPDCEARKLGRAEARSGSIILPSYPLFLTSALPIFSCNKPRGTTEARNGMPRPQRGYREASPHQGFDDELRHQGLIGPGEPVLAGVDRHGGFLENGDEDLPDRLQELFRGKAEDPLPEGLTVVVGNPCKVADHGKVALPGRVRRPVQGPDRADDGLFQFLLADPRIQQPAGGPVVNLQRFRQVGVAVGQKGEDPPEGIVEGHPPVGAALYPDPVVEISLRELSRYHGERRRGGVEVARRCGRPRHVADLGCNRDSQLRRLRPHRCRHPSGCRIANPFHQGPDLSQQEIDPGCIARHVEKQSAATENKLFEAFHGLDERVGRKAFGKAAQKPQLEAPVPLLVPVGRQVQRRCRRSLGKEMARGDDGGLQAVSLLQDEVFHPPVVREISRREDVAKKCHGLGDIAMQSPHAEDHLLPGLLPVPAEARGKLNPQTSHGHGDPCGHLVIAAPCGPHAPCKFSKQRQVRLQVVGNMGHVKGAIQVDDPVAEDLVLQDGNTPDTALLGGDPLHSAGDVGSLEPGQCGKGLRCFGLRLERLQAGRLVADFFAVLFRQGRLQLPPFAAGTPPLAPPCSPGSAP